MLTLPAVAGAAESAASPQQPKPNRVELIGRAVSGSRILVTVRGRADATIDVLIVGVIHGNERAGLPIVRRLARMTPPRRVRYWIVESINPDGMRRNTRQNARGVDLNRNFPWRWRGGGRPFDTYYPGRSRASEPESRAMLRLIRRVRPDVTIWYHQHARMVIRPAGRWRQALGRTYERASGLAMREYPVRGLRGTAATWQEAEQRLSLALVVELPPGRLSRTSVAQHAEAVRRTAIAASRDSVVAR